MEPTWGHVRGSKVWQLTDWLEDPRAPQNHMLFSVPTPDFSISSG